TSRVRSNASTSCFSNEPIKRPYCRTFGFIAAPCAPSIMQCLACPRSSMPAAGRGRLLAAALAAVGEVGAHRGACAVGVARGDGAENTLVLGIHLGEVRAPLG